MERRSFLKNIFGAAVVAAMPKIVVEQIEKAPPETLTPKIDPVNGVEPVFVKQKDYLKGNFIYLYDNDVVIAGSSMFAFAMDRPIIHNFSFDDPEIAFSYSAPMSWKIAVDKLLWFNHDKGMSYFTRYEPLQFVAVFNNARITGEALLVECSIGAPMFGQIEEDIVLQGTGAITIETMDEPDKELIVAETGYSVVKEKKNDTKNKIDRRRNPRRLNGK
jgi:hypothetical protein